MLHTVYFVFMITADCTVYKTHIQHGDTRYRRLLDGMYLLQYLLLRTLYMLNGKLTQSSASTKSRPGILSVLEYLILLVTVIMLTMPLADVFSIIYLSSESLLGRGGS